MQPTVSDIVCTFDGEIYPRACLRLGQALDVDRDGRFTILLTGRLSKLCNGKVSLSGFVRGSDFLRDLEAPYGNRCDMMYLNTDLKPGPYLRSILAHEYTHAVVFSEHTFGPYLPEVPRQDEESWLNEGLAHLNEDLHGYSWSNLGHRLRAFLNAPEGYQLVVPDYYGAGVWRSHGYRGATYLFFRWCADQHGDDLLRRLTQTNLSGVANLEVATRQRFPDLFRDWSVNLLLSGTNLADVKLRPLHRDLHRVLDGRLLCGPRFSEVTLAGDCRDLSVAGTAIAYVLLHSSAGPRSCVTITSDPAADLQVSLVRLPQDTGRLSLCWQPADGPRTGRLMLTAHDADLRLDGGDVEPSVPKENLREDEKRSATAPQRTIQEWFDTATVKRGETRQSRLITLPETDGEFVFKVAATDAAGHRIAGWAMVPPAIHKTGFLKKPAF